MTTKTPVEDVTIQLLSQIIHDLNPGRSLQEWEEHVRKTCGNPKDFFGDNGEGYNEYLAFVSTFDKNKKKRNSKSSY